jgi:AbrB family looped-hinge helix DNA binding protein
MMAIFKGKAYGSANVGGRGQIVIPSHLRKDLKIRPGDQIMIFAEPNKKFISMMSFRDFNVLIARAGRVISRLEAKIPKRNKIE